VYGFDDVTIVLDSSAGAPLDTLYFRIPVPGDVYQFGFLSGVAHRRETRDIPQRWDRLTAFSLGYTEDWTMGTIDSAGVTRATARSTGDQVLFEVTVEGTRIAILGNRIVFTAGNVDGSYWVAPEGFLRFREERFLSPADSNGEVIELSEIDLP
jgi:hypothetical protein